MVDEVLAVGDARFQKKCLNKMEDISHSGRTVIFVSHNMSAVTRICQRAVLLEERTHSGQRLVSRCRELLLERRRGNKRLRASGPTSVEHPAASSAACERFGRGIVKAGTWTRWTSGRKWASRWSTDLLKPGYHLLPHYYLWNEEGIQVPRRQRSGPDMARAAAPGRTIRDRHRRLPGNFFAAGTIFVDVAIIAIDPIETQIHQQSVVAFQVIDSMDPDTSRGDWPVPWPVVRPRRWTALYAGGHGSESLTVQRCGGIRQSPCHAQQPSWLSVVVMAIHRAIPGS